MVFPVAPVRGRNDTQGEILMRFTIREIVLWPRRADLPPRRLALKPDKVNVISGVSKTGKSAIIPILDYCMAADRCAVPVETIRNSCCWFGLLADTDEGPKLFARREPEGQRSTGDMYIAEGPSVIVPDRAPTKNTTAEAVKRRLDELSGLTKLDFDYNQSGSGFKGRPSLRDLVAFTFQPQNIVANPDVLFFKADTYQHREKLRTIFPYVLQAIGPETLAAQHELGSVQRELGRKERELRDLQELSERWQGELRASVVQARELGLLDQAVSETASRDDLIELLERAAGAGDGPHITPEGIDDAITELVQLDREEADVDMELVSLRRRLAEMSKLKGIAARFKGALTIQRDRLAVARWLGSLDDKSHACPVCGLNGPRERVEELLLALTTLDESVKGSGAVSASLDREMLRVREDIKVAVEKLEGIAARRVEAGHRSTRAKQARFRQSEVSRFLGRIEKVLEVQRALGQDSVLSEEVEALRQRERELRSVISTENVEARKKRALRKIAGLAGRLLPRLDAERPDDPVELSITDLALKVIGQQRADYLWEIGSGANWLSYHIAISLALQQFFIANPSNPVPSFLIYDQPSQVYFPRRLARARTTRDDDDPVLEDEDVEAVRKVYETIAGVVERTNGGLQTLVLDHAGPDVWAEVPGVQLVEEWRDGRTLVPQDWLS